VYSIYLSLGLALAIGSGSGVLGWGWTISITLGFVAFLGTWIVIGRRFNKQIQPTMMKAQKLAESGQAVLALNAVETLLPLGDWIPMLKGQLYAQMGVLSLGARKEDQAILYLEKATNRAAEGKLCLACLYYKKGKFKEARRVLQAAQKLNRKHVLLHNVYAYLLKKEGDTEGAIAQLHLLLRKVPENEASQDNLSRLKNDKKMTMKSFGMHWYSLGLERPPASMAMPGHMQQQPRKGFRQPSKKRG
jgi:tetratricopeptide (TPR) repeat protein